MRIIKPRISSQPSALSQMREQLGTRDEEKLHENYLTLRKYSALHKFEYNKIKVLRPSSFSLVPAEVEMC